MAHSSELHITQSCTVPALNLAPWPLGYLVQKEQLPRSLELAEGRIAKFEQDTLVNAATRNRHYGSNNLFPVAIARDPERRSLEHIYRSRCHW